MTRILPKPISFEWDKGNIEKNWNKHNVTQKEAEETFINKPFFVVNDKKHSSKEEQRFQALGKSKSNRKLFLVFTIREISIRIISARDMNKKERSMYEKIKTNT